jgi:hypothetical protein
MYLTRLLLAALFFTLNVSAYAEVSVVRHFRLGESDAGAAHGVPAGAGSRDAAGIGDLVVAGAPVYSATVANANSMLSMGFDGATQYATTAGGSSLTTNFGVEVWVTPAAADGEHYTCRRAPAWPTTAGPRSPRPPSSMASSPSPGLLRIRLGVTA